MKKLDVDNEIIEVVSKVCYLVLCTFNLLSGFLLVVNMTHLSLLAVTISFWQISPIAYPLHPHFLLLLTNGNLKK